MVGGHPVNGVDATRLVAVAVSGGRTPISMSTEGSRLYALSITRAHRYALDVTADEGTRTAP